MMPRYGLLFLLMLFYTVSMAQLPIDKDGNIIDPMVENPRT